MRFVLAVSLLFGLAPATRGADDVDYQRDVRPLLAEKCGACHSALKQESGLRLDAGRLIHQGSEDGAVIVPGQAAASRLIERVTAADAAERMPPEGEGERLTPAQVAVLTAWIDAGAPFPEDEAVLEDPRQHWAYQIPQRPAVPHVHDPAWSHPIDAFIAREHAAAGIQAVATADSYTLVRRLYFDLLGLPPTREQLAAFMADPSPRAWPALVDSLLDNPHYGERWGRHWMDVWRYSDWDGYKEELRSSQRHIWHWRDWIVESLNEDKGYDRMLTEMLAGDEIAPEDSSALAATGYLARNFHKSNRNIWLDATVEHTAKAFLGMTLNCARCHDHKFDPIPQVEYYQFRAIFEPHQVRTDRLPGTPDVKQAGLPRAYDADLAAATYLYRQGNEKHPDKENPVSAAVPGVLAVPFEVQPVELPRTAYYPALTDFIIEEDLAAARRQLTTTQSQLTAAREAAAKKASADSVEPPGPPADLEPLERKQAVAELRLRSLEARLAADRAKHLDGGESEELARAAARLEREFNLQDAELTRLEKQAALDKAKAGKEPDEKKKQTAITNAQKALDEADKQLTAAREAAASTDAKYTPFGTEYSKTSSGRRSALARWITSPQNPLTARVAVNHIWMRHFGEPLVDNVFDFGLRTPRPRHAELLDWLAVELMEHGWSMKHIHRLILTSRTWRLASSTGPAAAVDPDNHLLWRSHVRRLDAEVIRDNVLAVSGRLDSAFGGPDIDFREGEKSRRRSIYLRHAYEKQMTMLVLFDAPSPSECYRRSESIQPQQALALANSTMSFTASRQLARQLWQDVEGNPVADDAATAFIQAAFLQVLSRPAGAEELAACRAFLSEQSRLLEDPKQLTTFAGGGKPELAPAEDPRQRARENLIHVLLNHNDFVSVR